MDDPKDFSHRNWMEMPVANMENILEGTSFGESHRHSFGHAEFEIRVYI